MLPCRVLALILGGVRWWQKPTVADVGVIVCLQRWFGHRLACWRQEQGLQPNSRRVDTM